MHEKFEEHIREGAKYRDMVVSHENRIELLAKTLEGFETVRRTAIFSALSVVLTVGITAMSVASTWGGVQEKIRSLEEWRKDFSRGHAYAEDKDGSKTVKQ